MAVFNFKTTEDSTPGGGVVKLKGNGPTWSIYQSEYPDYNLANMTANNFFKRTICNASGEASQTNTQEYTHIESIYTGGSTKIKYSYANGTGTVSIEGSNRKVNVGESDLATYTKPYSEVSAGYTHTMYMSRDPII